MTRSCINFERKAILNFLDTNGDRCPVTNKPLSLSGLVSNSNLRWEIRQWQLYHGDGSREMTHLELESKLSKAEMASCDFALSDILRSLTEVETEPPANQKAARADVLSVIDDVMSTL